MTTFEYSLPAVRASQAGRDFFVSMCPAAMLGTLFRDDSDAADIDAKPGLNPERVPEITRYIVGNPASYVLPAITAVVDSEIRFDGPNGDTPASSGVVNIPMSAKLLLLDGQHRVAALKAAIAKDEKLASESVALVLFVDRGFRHVNKLFTDLKCNERKTPSSLRVFRADNDEIADITKALIDRIPAFDGMIEMSRSTISNRSRKLFTLSALYQANKILLSDRKAEPFEENLQVAIEFWTEVAAQFPEWSEVKEGSLSPADLRKQVVHVHGIALSAMARAGRTALDRNQKTWKKKLRGLKTIDWSRTATSLWEGRAMIGGRLSKSNSNIVLTGNAIKQHLGIALTEDELEIEERFTSRR